MIPGLIGSRYDCERLLGEGGFGKTYLAVDRLQGDRPCVVKVLSQKVDPEAAEKEFALLKNLYHPHIVEVLSAGVLEENKKSPYLVMEFVKGVPLDEGISSLRDKKGWEPIAQLCRTLSFIHSQKVIHGDLKPSNILLTKGRSAENTPGQIKVIDFGLSSFFEKSPARDVAAGTLAYMAPETIREGVRSPRSDLYALGILLYQLLNGRLPFGLTSEAALNFHLQEEPSFDLVKKHPWGKTLEKILGQLLQKEPSKRPHDALEILTLLNEDEEAGFDVHRGWRKTGEETLFFQKVDHYLDSVNQLLRLSSVACPRSFLAEELSRIEKYLRLTGEPASKESSRSLDRLVETKARILLQQGKYEEAVNLPGGSDGLKNIRALAQIYRENYRDAEKILTDVSEKSSDDTEKARAENYLGMACYNRGELDRAEEYFKKSYEEMRRLKETTGIVSNAMNLAAIYQQQGKIGEALQLYKDSLTAAKELKNSFLLSILLSNIGNLHLHVGALGEADDYLTKSQELAEKLDLKLLEGYNLLLAADLAMWRRDTVTADQKLEEATEIFKKLPSPMYLALAWINYAENGLRARLWTELPDRLSQSETVVSRTNLKEARFRLDLLKIRFQISQGEDLKNVLRRLDKLEKEGQTGRERLQILVTRAQGALARNEIALSEDYLNQARELYEDDLRSIPIAYRRNLDQAPRHSLFWELQEELARLKKAPADRSLWKLIEINQRLVGRRNPKEQYNLILDSAMTLTGAERGFLIMPEYGKWKRGTWKIQTARHFRDRDLPGGRDLLSQTIIQRVLQSKKPLLVHNAQEDEGLSQFKSVARLRLRSILAVPIIVYGEVIGALYLDHSDTANLFEEKDLDLIRAFADQAGIAMTQTRQYEELIRRQRSLEEARSKLEEANRRLEEELSKKTEWAERIGEELKKVQVAGPIVTRSVRMRHILKQLPSFAQARKPILLSGELGTGKDLLAKTLHQQGGVGPFVHRQALKLPRHKTTEEGLEVLPQLFDEARGGTLYLDEITDVPIPFQRDLFHLLQTRMELKEESVLVILSTRLSLKEAAKKGLALPEIARFLAGSEVPIPPLRERKEDINPLVHHFLRELSEIRAVHRGITRAAMGILHDHDWPGNVHELKLEIERAALASEVTIEPTDLSPNLLKHAGYVPGAPKKETIDLHDKRDQFERDYIMQILDRCGWNKVRAAKRIGLSRAMLYIKMRKYRIPLR